MEFGVKEVYQFVRNNYYAISLRLNGAEFLTDDPVIWAVAPESEDDPDDPARLMLTRLKSTYGVTPALIDGVQVWALDAQESRLLNSSFCDAMPAWIEERLQVELASRSNKEWGLLICMIRGKFGLVEVSRYWANVSDPNRMHLAKILDWPEAIEPATKEMSEIALPLPPDESVEISS